MASYNYCFRFLVQPKISDENVKKSKLLVLIQQHISVKCSFKLNHKWALKASCSSTGARCSRSGVTHSPTLTDTQTQQAVSGLTGQAVVTTFTRSRVTAGWFTAAYCTALYCTVRSCSPVWAQCWSIRGLKILNVPDCSRAGLRRAKLRPRAQWYTDLISLIWLFLN